MNRHQRLILKAMEIAKTSQHFRFKHGCVIARNNRVLSSGVNRHKALTLVDREHSTVHAEISALKSIVPSRRTTLYVARVNRSGEPMFSRPCSRCHEELRARGIDEVVYTLADGGFAVEKVAGRLL